MFYGFLAAFSLYITFLLLYNFSFSSSSFLVFFFFLMAFYFYLFYHFLVSMSIDSSTCEASFKQNGLDISQLYP